MPDNQSMKIKFKNTLVIGWKEIITGFVVVVTAAGIYYGMQHKIEDSANKISEVSERQVSRASYVDGKFESINNTVNDLKTGNAVIQSKLIDLEKNQVAIYQKLERMSDMIANRNQKDASYRTVLNNAR